MNIRESTYVGVENIPKARCLCKGNKSGRRLVSDGQVGRARALYTHAV